MTNRLAVIVGLLVVAAFLVDWLEFGLSGSLFLAQRLAALVEYMAFWR